MKGKKKKQSILDNWQNVWEDDRVENILRHTHPPSALYLEAARSFFLEQTVREQLLDDWDRHCIKNRIQSLLFAWVRVPLLVAKYYRGWRDVTGKDPLDTFEKLFPRSPLTEEEVSVYARRSKMLIDCWRTKYPANTYQLMGWLTRNDPDKVPNAKQIPKQLFFDIINSYFQGKFSPQKLFNLATEIYHLKAIVLTVRSRMFRYYLEHILDRLETFFNFEKTQIREYNAQGLSAKQKHQDESNYTVTFFSKKKTLEFPRIDVLEEVFKATQSIIEKGFRAEDITEIHRQLAEPANTTIERDDHTVMLSSFDGNDRNIRLYNDSVNKQTNEIQVLKSYLQRLVPNCRLETIHQQLRGRLDPRHVARGTFSGRIFKVHSSPQKRKEKEIILLLDQSGSIYGHAQTVFDAATLVVEAFQQIHGYRVIVFSHSTVGSFRIPIVYAYGSTPDIRKTLPDYLLNASRFRCNFDHHAIESVAKKCESKTGASVNRLMVVLNDGHPCGLHGVVKTREAVEALRRRHWRVISISVGTNGRFDDIYGKSHAVSSTFDTLSHNLGRLIFRELLGFS